MCNATKPTLTSLNEEKALNRSSITRRKELITTNKKTDRSSIRPLQAKKSFLKFGVFGNGNM